MDIGSVHYKFNTVLLIKHKYELVNTSEVTTGKWKVCLSERLNLSRKTMKYIGFTLKYIIGFFVSVFICCNSSILPSYWYHYHDIIRIDYSDIYRVKE